LSLRRAERCRDELIKLGIPKVRISVAGRGEREPEVPTADEVAEPRNRRVEISVR
jgi:outer membrane protein OmpA-like peptidoglycan-associated protein